MKTTHITYGETPPWVRGRGHCIRSRGSEIGNTPVGTGKRLLLPVVLILRRKHPRGYGEESTFPVKLYPFAETPPWVRGRVYTNGELYAEFGNTPVGTGKRVFWNDSTCRWEKHPRGYGEECIRTRPLTSSMETPPWVRGRVPMPPLYIIVLGNTPVGTGKSPVVLSVKASMEKHPRGYGEEGDLIGFSGMYQETPPWVRGRATMIMLISKITRNTPVGTGKRHCTVGFPR